MKSIRCLLLALLVPTILTMMSCQKESSTEPSIDSEKPTVSILYPTPNAELSPDTVYTIIADAADNTTVAAVTFWIDGDSVATDYAKPYECKWSTLAQSGNHSIQAKARDGSGNLGQSGSIIVKVKLDFVVSVTGGVFTMGDAEILDATPMHSVTVSTFSIDRTEITYEKWTSVRSWALSHGYSDLAEGRNGYKGSGTNHPITRVSWNDAVKWCNARSEKYGLTPVYYADSALSTVYRTGEIDLTTAAVKWGANGYRLPTEAEWEFAARGGLQSKGYRYSGSNNLDEVAWYISNSGMDTHPVATKTANELGVYDMTGNVWEYCWDRYGSYSSAPQTDPRGPSSGSLRTMRGGTCIGGGTPLTFRHSPGRTEIASHMGVRCVQR
jgi:formylglycine-generating enzyme required for sulfatase activity